eukprot:TRINITY_DN5243_c0_g1_i3.p1 TRINITY_DN5243_c0_g1~~TRINITY_DN5243_c0_g1_i3.p1  ORF type:complete len:272 (-),score=29.95 TRINITY_DN5243_c0_g1_i3:7-822(-)
MCGKKMSNCSTHCESLVYVLDLMINKHMFMYGVPTATSEHAVPELYNSFSLCAVPYPGNEFFAHWHKHAYTVDNFAFDWRCEQEPHIPASMNALLPAGWGDYKRWKIVGHTQKYLLLILQTLLNGDGGLMIHCVSGWDRTPLWISLIRMSLWADGEAHQSLSAAQMLFLTLTYDWLLFGHRLFDRVKKGHDIMLWCFHATQYIDMPEYSVHTLKGAQPADSDVFERRKERLTQVREMFIKYYVTDVEPQHFKQRTNAQVTHLYAESMSVVL